MYAPATELHNFHPGNTTRILESIEAAQNGKLREWVVNSDSSSTLAITGGGPTYDHLLAWPILMLDELEDAGVPINGTGMVRTQEAALRDARWTSTGTWFTQHKSFAYCTANGATRTFTTNRAGDRVTLRYYDGGTAEPGVFSVTIAGGTPNTVTNTSTAGWRNVTFNESITAGQTVVMSKTSGTYMALASICVWNSTGGGLLLHNVGQGGSGAYAGSGTGHDTWVETGAREALGDIYNESMTVTGEAAVVIVSLGANDMMRAASNTDTANAIEDVRDRYPTADCILIGETQLNDTLVDRTTWVNWLTAEYALATSLDLPLIDQDARLGPYTQIVADGKNADTDGHLTAATLEDLGRSTGAALLTQGATTMAVSAKFYGNFFVNACDKKIDFNSDTIKVALCTSSYTPDQDAHDFFNDITNEVSGTGYTAGGATLGSPTITYTGGTNTLKLDGDDVSWSSSTITARYAIIYDSTPGTAATNPLIAYVDFDGNISSTAGTFTIAWDSAGICTITVS